MKATRGRPKVKVTACGKGVVNHAGAALVAELAEHVGLTDALSEAMAPTRRRRSAHEPGKVLSDVAVALVSGATSLSDLAALRDQAELFGPVASNPTAWRVIDSIDNQCLEAIHEARAKARAAAWGSGAAPKHQVVLDFDATLVTSHSEKQLAAPTYKHGFGFHPLMCYLDETKEALAGMLRPGNAGSNTAADHIVVLEDALAQLPVKTKAADPHAGVWMLARGDSAAATHEFVDALRSHRIEFSIGLPINEDIRQAVLAVPTSAWVEAITQDCEPREGAEVAEITAKVDLSAWPEGTRAICRREDPHPGAQISFTDADGHRFQVFICDSDDADLAYLEARHRGHARVEDRIRGAKDNGLSNFPFHDFAPNAAWLSLVMMAQDLTAWTQRLCLEGELAVAEPKRLRYCLWHTAGRLVRGGRQFTLHLAATWRWSPALVAAFGKLRSLPLVA